MEDLCREVVYLTVQSRLRHFLAAADALLLIKPQSNVVHQVFRYPYILLHFLSCFNLV